MLSLNSTNKSMKITSIDSFSALLLKALFLAALIALCMASSVESAENSQFFTRNVKQLAALTVQHSVPAIYNYREFAAAGGLMSYGTNITDAHRLAGIYAGRILKGEKPADLSVQQATTKVEMYINLKTARALGITITLPLSGRADEIFE